MGQNSKIWIIFKHEYLIKLKSKGFILSTLLMPLGIVVIIGVIALVTYLSINDTSKKLAIYDESGLWAKELINADSSIYYLYNGSLQTLRDDVQESKIDGFVSIDADFLQNGEAEIVSGGGGIGLISSVESDLSHILKQKRLEKYVTDPEIIALLSSGVHLKKSKLDDAGDASTDHSEMLAGLGYMFGMLVYMMMLMYGSMVMRSCIEEKANRIVEIIASSAKPMEIMMSKIMAIGALGLTQLLIWSSLGIGLLNLGLPLAMSQASNNPALASGLNSELGLSPTSLPSLDISMVLGLIFFFIAGYFIYATLFAAVGSAVDQEQDAQQLQTPLILPLIIPIFFLTNIITNPDGTMASILSIFPFFAPILMPVRLAATHVPFWELALCIALMVITFIGCLWVAGKIYRVGIMINGTQPKIKDLIRWIKLAK